MAEETITAQTPEIDPGMSVMPEGPGLMDVPTVIPELGLAAQALASQVSFAKKTWKDGSGGGTPVTAVELNRLEQGVADLTAAVNGLRDSVSQAVAFNAKKFEIQEGGKMRLTFSDSSNHSGGFIFSTGNGTPWYGLIGQDSRMVGNVTVERESINTFLVQANAWNYGVVIPISGTVVVEPA